MTIQIYRSQVVVDRFDAIEQPPFDTELSAAMLDGKATLESIAARALSEGLDPQPKSGRQERLEALLNRYI